MNTLRTLKITFAITSVVFSTFSQAQLLGRGGALSGAMNGNIMGQGMGNSSITSSFDQIGQRNRLGGDDPISVRKTLKSQANSDTDLTSQIKRQPINGGNELTNGGTASTTNTSNTNTNGEGRGLGALGGGINKSLSADGSAQGNGSANVVGELSKPSTRQIDETKQSASKTTTNTASESRGAAQSQTNSTGEFGKSSLLNANRVSNTAQSNTSNQAKSTSETSQSAMPSKKVTANANGSAKGTGQISTSDGEK